jgi:pimeloyl-ACP methyl ester carboxylesterase
MSLGARVDAALCGIGPAPRFDAPYALVDTRRSRLRVLDTGGDKPALLLAPDGPCVVEHYAPLIESLREQFRVVCADLPGFGFSRPRGDYAHTLRDGADVLLALLDALRIERATLALSCVNGFYAIAAAKLAPQRVTRLVLAQTPDFAAMRAWTAAMVPAPIAVPVVGQLLNRVTCRKIAHGWLRVAVADRTRRGAMQQVADHALCSGGCYCFAGVVQGMMRTRADEPLLHDVRVPATLVWGRLDRSHKATDPQSIRRHLPQARVVEVDTGHFPDLEAPGEYARLLSPLDRAHAA